MQLYDLDLGQGKLWSGGRMRPFGLLIRSADCPEIILIVIKLLHFVFPPVFSEGGGWSIFIRH